MNKKTSTSGSVIETAFLRNSVIETLSPAKLQSIFKKNDTIDKLIACFDLNKETEGSKSSNGPSLASAVAKPKQQSLEHQVLAHYFGFEKPEELYNDPKNIVRTLLSQFVLGLALALGQMMPADILSIGNLTMPDWIMVGECLGFGTFTKSGLLACWEWQNRTFKDFPSFRNRVENKSVSLRHWQKLIGGNARAVEGDEADERGYGGDSYESVLSVMEPALLVETLADNVKAMRETRREELDSIPMQIYKESSMIKTRHLSIVNPEKTTFPDKDGGYRHLIDMAIETPSFQTLIIKDRRRIRDEEEEDEALVPCILNGEDIQPNNLAIHVLIGKSNSLVCLTVPVKTKGLAMIPVTRLWQGLPDALPKKPLMDSKAKPGGGQTLKDALLTSEQKKQIEEENRRNALANRRRRDGMVFEMEETEPLEGEHCVEGDIGAEEDEELREAGYADDELDIPYYRPEFDGDRFVADDDEVEYASDVDEEIKAKDMAEHRRDGFYVRETSQSQSSKSSNKKDKKEKEPGMKIGGLPKGKVGLEKSKDIPGQMAIRFKDGDSPSEKTSGSSSSQRKVQDKFTKEGDAEKYKTKVNGTTNPTGAFKNLSVLSKAMDSEDRRKSNKSSEREDALARGVLSDDDDDDEDGSQRKTDGKRSREYITQYRTEQDEEDEGDDCSFKDHSQASNESNAKRRKESREEEEEEKEEIPQPTFYAPFTSTFVTRPTPLFFAFHCAIVSLRNLMVPGDGSKNDKKYSSMLADWKALSSKKVAAFVQTYFQDDSLVKFFFPFISKRIPDKELEKKNWINIVTDGTYFPPSIDTDRLELLMTEVGAHIAKKNEDELEELGPINNVWAKKKTQEQFLDLIAERYELRTLLRLLTLTAE